MAYFRAEEQGSGIDKPGENEFITRSELYAILDQTKKTNKFYELEPFEVMDIYRDGGRVSQEGAVIGRYIFSEQGDSVEDMKEYIPLDSNNIQQPLVGEYYLGFTFRDKRYYFGRIMDNTTKVNPDSTDFNKSSLLEVESLKTDDEDLKVLNSDNVDTKEFVHGDLFVNDNSSRINVEEGGTLIQGRFKNVIKLGNSLKNDSGNIKLISGIDYGSGTLFRDKSSIYLTTNEKVLLSYPSKDVMDKDYDKPQLILDSDRIVINSKNDEIGLSAKKNITIDSDEGDILLNAADRIRLRPRNSKIDFITINGQKRDFANPNGDILLPKFIKERAGDFKPLIDIIKAELLALPYLILPPTLPGGVPNPSFMIGMKIKYDVIKSYIELIKYFIDLEWLPKFDFELVNLQEVLDALGLSSLPGLDELGGFEGVLADIASAKAKIEVLKGTVDGLKSKAAVVSNQVSQIQKGEFDGSPSDFIKTLDDFESDEENPKIDTTDIREIIADGTLNSTEELTRYFQNGGSPHLAALSMEAGKKQQEVEQLDQVVKLAEISKLTQEE